MNFRLTGEQIEFAIKQMTTWIEIKLDQGQKVGVADPSHSALLFRLLSGKKPLPKPPPRSFSRPNYELAEGEPVKIELCEHDDGVVVVDQDGGWEWQDKVRGRLVYQKTGDVYKYDPETKVLVRLIEDEKMCVCGHYHSRGFGCNHPACNCNLLREIK